VLEEHINNIKVKGFTLIKNVFDSETCDQAKNLSKKLIRDISNKIDYNDRGASNSPLSDKSQEKVLNNLQNKDYFYFNFISNKVICDTIKLFLQEGSYENKEPFHLTKSQVRCLKPYAKKQQLHIDGNLPGRGGYALVMVAIVMLDDFTEENGPTRVVPKSHLRDQYAENDKTYPDEITITGKAGDLIIINSATWHGSAENITDKERWSINLGYARWFIKPSFDIARSLNRDIYDKMNDFEKDLLGLKTVPPIDEFQRLTRKSLNDFLPWDQS
tara:strand:+ start:2888 stop:3706 length:819 start_codon:yes stop_codon:yes gene_type:complete